jgi:hypothetical protein
LEADQNTPEIRLTTLNGNIEIGAPHADSQHPEKPAAENARAETTVSPAQAPVEGAAAARPATEGTPTPGQTGKQQDHRQPAYDSQLAILQALGERQISVEEADRLLRSLEA